MYIYIYIIYKVTTPYSPVGQRSEEVFRIREEHRSSDKLQITVERGRVLRYTPFFTSPIQKIGFRRLGPGMRFGIANRMSTMTAKE